MCRLNTKTETISDAHFAHLTKAAGLELSPSELVVMRRGYIGLQVFITRLPEQPDVFDEPATTFAPLGAAAL